MGHGNPGHFSVCVCVCTMVCISNCNRIMVAFGVQVLVAGDTEI